MRRVFKWIFRTVGVIGVMISAALLFYILAAPGLAERQLLKSLRELGIDDATVQVRSIGANYLQVTDLNLGEDAGLQLGAVGVEYDLSLAGSVRVKSIDIVGAELDLRMRDGQLDIGPLAKIKGGGEPGHADDGLPFDVLKLRASSLRLEWNGQTFVAPLEATLTHQGKGICHVNAKVSLLGVEVPVTGTMDFTAPAMTTGNGQTPMLADGITFNLQIPVHQSLMKITGLVGGPRSHFSLAASISDTDETASSSFNASARIDRENQATKLVLHASGDAGQWAVALASYGIDARGLDVNFDAALDLDKASGTASLRASSQSFTIKSNGASTIVDKPTFIMNMTGDWARDLHIQSSQNLSLAIEKTNATDDGGRQVMERGEVLTKIDLLLPSQDQSKKSPRLTIEASLHNLAAQMGHITISAKEANAFATMTFDEHQGIDAGGTITLKRANIISARDAFAFNGIDVTMPVHMGAGRQKDSAGVPVFHIDSIQYKQDRFAAMDGALSIEQGILQGDISWPLFENAPAKVTANVDLGNGFAGRLTVKVQDLHITDPNQVATKLMAAKAFKVTGYFGLDADIAFDGSNITPRVTVTAKDAMFASGDIDFVANGINTSITLNSFTPLSTAPNQRLAASEGHIGKLNFKDAIINFRLDAIDAMVVELAAWRVGEKGRFWVHAARFNPLKPVLETQVFIEDMSVATWLDILQDGDAKGEGYMYGRLPIRVDQSSEYVLTFGEGFLYAKPGKGWIKLSDRPEARRQAYTTLEEAIADLTREAKARMLEAVNDFEFDTLKFDFVRENNGILCVVSTSGRGRAGFKQPIGGLTVNIHGFGELLSRQLLRNADSMGAVDDLLQRIFDQ